ncbi:MAG TPA: DUF547 domain-containing protein [Bryobacteraceae bacterium]|nr:DUF547 domain-containing protein [Bryobacteraceae bacterium]
MRKIAGITITGLLMGMLPPGAIAQPRKAANTVLLDGVLRRFVQPNGKVRYAELKVNLAPLNEYVHELAAVSPDSDPLLYPSRAARLAYWIDTYNALVLWSFARDYPAKRNRLATLVGRGLFFELQKFTVGGQRLSLDTIETGKLRAAFHEPRIHFAIVCASSGCPWLAPEAYTEGNVEQLLDQRARLFVNQRRNVVIDWQNRRVILSRIFDWYRSDFGGSDSAVLEFIGRYRQDQRYMPRSGWKISYFDYDWSPNDAGD